MSALPPKADIRPRDQDVCFGPNSDMQIPFGDLPTCVWVKEVAINRRANLTRWRRVREVANGAISVAPGPGR
jgi:hypothetical protein